LPAPAPEETVHSPVHAPGRLEILWTQNSTIISRVMFYSLIHMEIKTRNQRCLPEDSVFNVRI
jgi:hypothetical protein